MPFFACRECGAEISAEDQFCPRCGVPRPVSFDSGGFGAALDRGVERVRMAAKIALASFVVLAVAAAGVSIRAAAREAAATEELAQKAAEARANVFVAVRDSLIERASLAVGGSEFTQALSILGPWQDLGDPVVDSLVSIARPAARSERRRAERAERAERAMAALPQWRTFESVDKMTGNRSHSALSPRAKAAKTMGFPYRGSEQRPGSASGAADQASGPMWDSRKPRTSPTTTQRMATAPAVAECAGMTMSSHLGSARTGGANSCISSPTQERFRKYSHPVPCCLSWIGTAKVWSTSSLPLMARRERFQQHERSAEAGE
jgi:zinc ribbon protein